MKKSKGWVLHEYHTQVKCELDFWHIENVYFIRIGISWMRDKTTGLNMGKSCKIGLCGRF